MPDKLESTLADLKQAIAAGDYRSEAEISRGVVTRILDALDWPVYDIHVVSPEFKIGTRKVDYALCHPARKPSVLLEVKDFGKAKEKGEKQLFEYCFHQGVPIAVLTDGRTWSVFFPSGQGGYEDRRFCQIDLVDGDPGDSARNFTHYLSAREVRSGEARNRAERQYDAARREKEAESKYVPVWQKLLSGPEPLLLDLFLEEVEQAAGVRPDSSHATKFIRDQVRAKPPTRERKRRERTADGQPRHSFTFRGQTETFETAKQLMAAIFVKLAAEDSTFCERYSERGGMSKSRPARAPISLPGGWWVSAGLSNSNKIARIKKACEVAGLVWGKDLVVDMASGWPWSGRGNQP